jgi:hypothetical protein
MYHVRRARFEKIDDVWFEPHDRPILHQYESKLNHAHSFYWIKSKSFQQFMSLNVQLDVCRNISSRLCVCFMQLVQRAQTFMTSAHEVQPWILVIKKKNYSRISSMYIQNDFNILMMT